MFDADFSVDSYAGDSAGMTLYELNNMVRSLIDSSFTRLYWVRAELSEVRQNRGHCYLEFVQKSPSGDGLIAKARGQIWASRWLMLREAFMRISGQSLSSGMNVLVQVQVQFHELYGYSLNVLDIDPSYTLGDIARKRRAILKQLEEEGILTMNKELPVPRVIRRIAVISSSTAAGYGDFMSQIRNAPCPEAYEIKLFEASMQGGAVEDSIISALNAVALDPMPWDVVVILRGGGAASDLTAFDSLNLAENVAQFPLPVITGIGHERDDTVIDLIANTRVKTPTAAAEFLIHIQENELNLLTSLSDKLAVTVSARMKYENERLRALISPMAPLCNLFYTREKARLERLAQRIVRSSVQTLASAEAVLTAVVPRLKQATGRMLDTEDHKLQLAEQKISDASPERLLRLGYSITLVDGHAVRSASGLRPGQVITTVLASGTVESEIRNIDADSKISDDL